MASAAFTTTNLPVLRSRFEEWSAKQPPPRGFTSKLPDAPQVEGIPDGKDVVVALRTRPPLAGEAARFSVPADAVDDEATKDGQIVKEGDLAIPEFCPGISVPSAEPGVFIAHVPTMKVSTQHSSIIHAN
jgi:kinesin family member 2/24